MTNDETVKAALRILQDAKKKTDDALVSELESKLREVGFASLADEVLAKGLPKLIMSSTDIYPETKRLLNMYARVVESKYLPNLNVAFSWSPPPSDISICGL